MNPSCAGESGDPLHQRVPPASEGKCLEVRQSRQGLWEQVIWELKTKCPIQSFQGRVLGSDRRLHLEAGELLRHPPPC